MEVVTVVGASGDQGGLWEVVVVVFRGSDASRVVQPSPAVGRTE